LSRCIKVDTLGRLCDDDLERSYNPFTITNVYFIGAAYNSYFLIIYKPLSLIISPQTFSTQLGADIAWFCLSQCAIPFYTLSASATAGGVSVGSNISLKQSDQRAGVCWQRATRERLSTENFRGSDNEI